MDTFNINMDMFIMKGVDIYSNIIESTINNITLSANERLFYKNNEYHIVEFTDENIANFNNTELYSICLQEIKGKQEDISKRYKCIEAITFKQASINIFTCLKC